MFLTPLKTYTSELWQNHTVGLLGGSFNPAHFLPFSPALAAGEGRDEGAVATHAVMNSRLRRALLTLILSCPLRGRRGKERFAQ